MKRIISLILVIGIVTLITTACTNVSREKVTYEELESKYDRVVYFDPFCYDSKVLKGNDKFEWFTVLMEAITQGQAEDKGYLTVDYYGPMMIFFNNADNNYIVYKTDDFKEFYSDEDSFEYDVLKEKANLTLTYDEEKEFDIESLSEDEYVMLAYSEVLKTNFNFNFLTKKTDELIKNHNNYNFIIENQGFKGDGIALWKKNNETGLFEFLGNSEETAVFYKNESGLFVNEEGEYISSQKLRELYYEHR